MTVQEAISKLRDRVELCETQLSYKESLKEQHDWFAFENRIRDVVVGLLNPTMKRVEETRDKLAETYEHTRKMDEVQVEFEMILRDLTADKAESFRFKVMEEIQIKYSSIKSECEKREQLLLNSISLFDDKIDYLKQRIAGQSSQLKTQDERVDELLQRLRREFKQGDTEIVEKINEVKE